MAEEPLRDYELKVLRGMMDEYRYKEEHAKHAHEFWTTGKLWVVSVAAVVLFVLQFIIAIITIRHG